MAPTQDAPGLGLAPDGPPLVEVAIDAAGGGGSRTYTYHLPDRLADIQPGEAVLVEYGRREALAVVLGPAAERPGVATKPVAERVRADGPLLPPLSLRLARWISATYLAPPAIVLRAMLPPGFLERLELVAEAAPADTSTGPEPIAPSSTRPTAICSISSRGAPGRCGTWRHRRAGERSCGAFVRLHARASRRSTGRSSVRAAARDSSAGFA